MALSDMPAFDAEGRVRVVVESPRGSAVKFKYDAGLGAFTLSRPLIDGVTYPYDWGFVPSTRGPDGDPIDAMILWDRASYPGMVIPCRVIGLLKAEQNSKLHRGKRERNDRVLAVPAIAPKLAAITDVRDLSPRLKRELEAFFAAAVALEDKGLKLLGWSGAARATAMIRQSAAGG